MRSVPLIKRQFLILLVFSFLVSVASIIHGIFFDMDFSQVARLTFEGLVFTFIILFPAILFLEWVYDLNNEKKFKEFEARIKKLEKKKLSR